MKKYETPVLEVIQVNDLNNLMDDSQDPYADAKQHTIIFEEIVEEEEPDTTSIWNSDPWNTKYSLWDED
jgi:hypothetical protein